MTARPFQLFPALPAATESALRASIERWGVLVPVVKDQHGEMLDGHHRSRIADALGVDYQTTVLSLADDDDRRAIAVTLNADRRQLDAGQRQEVVEGLRRDGHSYPAIAAALGVSISTVHGDAQGFDTETLTTVGRDGKRYPAKITGRGRADDRRIQAALDVLGDAALDLPATTLDARRIERIAREHLADQRRAEPVGDLITDEVEIRHGDFREVLRDLCGTVDAIITDPPYEASWVPMFDDLGELAANLLTPDGVLVVMTGHMYLPQYLEHLAAWLRYRWIGCYLTPGPRSRSHVASVAGGWKPLLVFHRDGATFRPLLDDVFTSDADDKADDPLGQVHHHWGQSESGMAAIVDRFTTPGQLVVDPCLGGGTTAVVCRDLDRRFVGCDIDAAAIHATRERLT